MESKVREPLNFGPSKRYLQMKKLIVGDTLTFNLVHFEPEEIDTEWGSKWQLTIHILKSSSKEAKEGECIWNTVASAPRNLIQHLIKENIPHREYTNWEFKLTMVENGVVLDEVVTW